MGKIELIIGPMFAGKTDELMRKIETEALAEKVCLVVRPTVDTRYPGALKSHRGHTFSEDLLPCIQTVQIERLEAIDLSDKHYSVIGIEEGWMFPDLARMANRWADAGLRVIIASIDGDYKQETFPQIAEVLASCESVTKVKGVCLSCKMHRSAFSVLNESAAEGTAESAAVNPGGKEKYSAICRACLNSRKNQ